MEKSCIMNIKIESHPDCDIHHLYKGSQPFHHDYGLWICGVSRKGISKPRDNPRHRRYFEFYCISHLLEGDGLFWEAAPNKDILMKPGQAAIVSPGQIHCYGAVKNFYCEDAICFSGPLADALCRHGILQTGVLEMGKARRLLPIISMAEDPAIGSQLQANLELQKLINELHEENLQQHNRERYPQLPQLLNEIKSHINTWWSVEEMAEFCNLSTAQFRRVFVEHTGLTPKNYADRIKTHHAIQLLTTSDSPIELVANRLGYADPFHFSKRFKQITGVSPTFYREQYRRSNGILLTPSETEILPRDLK